MMSLGRLVKRSILLVFIFLVIITMTLAIPSLESEYIRESPNLQAQWGITVYHEYAGWYFESLPIADVEPVYIREKYCDGAGFEGSCDLVYYYNSSKKGDPWMAWNKSKPDSENDITVLTQDMGIWVRVEVEGMSGEWDGNEINATESPLWSYYANPGWNAMGWTSSLLNPQENLSSEALQVINEEWGQNYTVQWGNHEQYIGHGIEPHIEEIYPKDQLGVFTWNHTNTTMSNGYWVCNNNASELEWGYCAGSMPPLMPWQDQPPELDDAGVVEEEDGTYTFHINYTDPQAQPPSTKYVYINDEPHEMTNTSNTFQTGTKYEYNTNLDIGLHEYYFVFNNTIYETQRPWASQNQDYNHRYTVNITKPQIEIIRPKDGYIRHIPEEWINSDNETYITRHTFNVTHYQGRQLETCGIHINETLVKTIENPEEGTNRIFYNTTVSQNITYQVKCTDTENETGQSKPTTHKINIKPTVKVEATNTTWNTFLFNASESYDRDGEIMNYTWRFFGDGTTTTTKEPVVEHTFNQNIDYKSYLIVVEVRDNEGGKTEKPVPGVIITRPLNQTKYPEINWRTQLPKFTRRIEADMGQDENNIYIGTNINTHGVYAIDKETGQIQWNITTPAGITGDPLVQNGVLYQVTADSTLYALNLTNQETIWITEKLSRGAYPPQAQPVIHGDRIYTQTTGRFYAFNKTNGETLASKPHLAGYSTPTIHEEVLYIGSRRSKLYALDPYTLEEIWTAQTGYRWIDSKPIILNNTVIACADGVYALNKTNGQKIWHYKTGSILGTPTIEGEMLYIGTKGNPSQQGGKLHALNLTTKNYTWIYQVNATGNHDWILSDPIIHGNQVYITTGQGNLEAINKETGKKEWSYSLSGWTSNTPTIDRETNTLYAASRAGGLIYSFNLTKIDEVIQGQFEESGGQVKQEEEEVGPPKQHKQETPSKQEDTQQTQSSPSSYSTPKQTNQEEQETEELEKEAEVTNQSGTSPAREIQTEQTETHIKSNQENNQPTTVTGLATAKATEPTEPLLAVAIGFLALIGTLKIASQKTKSKHGKGKIS